MSEPKLISPLLDNYIVGDSISEKMGVICCPALERDSQAKCIVKIVSTPTSQSQLDALLLSGAYSDAQSALAYFRTVADSIIDEAKVLQRLAQLEGFCSYINWQLVPMTDGVGFDVYMLSEYRKTLAKLLRGDNLTHLAAVNLGLDLCTALAVCRRIGYLYVNLKSENIYLSDNNTWKIGDIGFIRLDSLKYASLPERYRSEYTAPEINDAFASLNTTLDVYALGLVLYRIYNGNQLPTNFDEVKNTQLPPPDYADYELSEIILKACDPNPDKRWQDPIEMGQALVSYMQRNGVNDTPIIPAPTITEQESPVSATSESNSIETSEENKNQTINGVDADFHEPTETAETDQNILSEATNAPPEQEALFLVPSCDETAPEQNEDQLEGIEVTDEVSDMLLQADELIAYPTPDLTDLSEEAAASDDVPEEDATELNSPALTVDNADDAEPVSEASCAQATIDENTADALSSEDLVNESDISQLDSSIDEDATDDEVGVEKTEVSEESTETDISVVANTTTLPTDKAETDSDNANEPSNDEVLEIEDRNDKETHEDDKESSDEQLPKKTHWFRNLLIGLTFVALVVFAFLFYTRYYLKTIDSLNVVKSSDGTVSINLSTKADETVLSVVCTDAAGIIKSSPVKNGTATFENLTPGAAYTVKVTIDGFHGLTGKTETEFTAPAIMKILDFAAQTGDVDGSVVLGFMTQDQDSEEWSVTYTDDNGNPVVETFSGHTHTIYDLTVGNTYTFVLAPAEDMEYTGTTEVTHTATNVVIPEDLHVISIVDGKMTISWSAPADSPVQTWIINCVGNKGFQKEIKVDTTTAVIDGVDVAEAYTIEVAASGMSANASVSLPENAVAITNFNASENGTELSLSWNCTPSEQHEWTLVYRIDGTEAQEIKCSGNSAELENFIPEATYSFLLKDANDTEPLGGRFEYKTATADKFSGYHVKSTDMRFYPCKTPTKSNWTKKDLSASDFTTTFSANEKMSFLVELKVTYNTSKDPITTMFVFRDEEGVVVDFSTSTQTWTKMWFKGLCELDVPSIPSEAGKYTVSIYMNGMFAGESKVTIK